MVASDLRARGRKPRVARGKRCWRWTERHWQRSCRSAGKYSSSIFMSYQAGILLLGYWAVYWPQLVRVCTIWIFSLLSTNFVPKSDYLS
jgi:hypothetical protein